MEYVYTMYVYTHVYTCIHNGVYTMECILSHKKEHI